MSIHQLFYPRGVAIVGSMTVGKLGYELMKQVLEGGYSSVYAVNPKSQGAFSVAGFQRILDIPSPIDMAVIASPADSIMEVLEDCHEAGVQAAVIITSGFSEVGNNVGEDSIRLRAREFGIRIVGPNCAGIVCGGAHLYATLESRPPVGNVALISQSGALGGAVLSWAEEQGIGISKFVSYGNRADLDEVDLLPYLAEDDETRVVALYIESVRDGRNFMRAVSKFCMKKPLVIIKSGRTKSGTKAALSHTGSMAGSDGVYDTAIKQCGAIRVETIEEMFDVCKGFSMLPAVKGRKVVIVTNSGGPGILTADKAESSGLHVSTPSEPFNLSLRHSLPQNCGLNNPIDLTVQGTEKSYRQVLEEALQEFDCAIAINVATPYLDSVALARGIADASESSSKPIAASFMAGRIVKESIEYLTSRRIPNFATGERAAFVLSKMASYSERRVELIVSEIDSHASIELPKERLIEPEIMAWLRKNNFPVLPYRHARSLEEACQSALEIGFPLVMKVVSPDILHKSDVGGVILGIPNANEVQAAYERLQVSMEGKRNEGVILYPTVSKSLELILGGSRDPQFGPVVLLGMGGIYTEILHDVVMRVAPFHSDEAIKMVTELRAFPLLQGVRGQPGIDLDQLARLVARLGDILCQYPQIREIDINPLFASSSGFAIGDARMILADLGKENDDSV
jgi:acyl-CoA synthetase (NDP forming)